VKELELIVAPLDGLVIDAVGAVLSTTDTMNEPVAVLPAPSFAIQVTVVVPSGKVVPEAGAQIGVILPLTVSLAVIAYVTIAPAELVA
jgi:hypothetical protein